jgi:hypothetical protein
VEVTSRYGGYVKTWGYYEEDGTSLGNVNAYFALLLHPDQAVLTGFAGHFNLDWEDGQLDCRSVCVCCCWWWW